MALDLNKIYSSHPVGGYAEKPLNLVAAILPTIYIIAAFILFLYFIFGGFTMLSAGSDPKKTESGQQALTNAIIGFVLIFTSYWIIQIIQIITGVPILKGN